jgi:hypothetical protein
VHLLVCNTHWIFQMHGATINSYLMSIQWTSVVKIIN